MAQIQLNTALTLNPVQATRLVLGPVTIQYDAVPPYVTVTAHLTNNAGVIQETRSLNVTTAQAVTWAGLRAPEILAALQGMFPTLAGTVS
jgi:hypothetical protein